MKKATFAVVALAIVSASAYAAKPARNVILMIADGTGFNAYRAASMYEGRLGKEVFNGKGWIPLAVTTYSLSTKQNKTGLQDPKVVYSPENAWFKYDHYKWLTSTPTDSAAAATAMGTGNKTYNSAIGMGDLGEKFTSLNTVYHQAGKSAGVVTTVLWSDATPSGMVAHAPKRGLMADIAKEMVERSGIEVIMGAGHPWYDHDGKRLAKIDVDNAKWNPYFAAPQTAFGDARLIETKADFEALAAGKLDLLGKKRVVGTFQATGATQQERSTRDWNGDGKVDGADARAALPFADPLVTTVPSLATMATGALNVLSTNKNGFFLMVEGGAVDHANHANQPGRMIEEAVDFFRAVETVSKWVEKHGGWKENLVIVTADHETGCLWGPNSDKVAFDPIVDQGKGKQPLVKYNSGGHTNSLVPLFAKGAGADEFLKYAIGKDPVRGAYLNNIDIFKVISSAATKR